jgi:hypothetical protein
MTITLGTLVFIVAWIAAAAALALLSLEHPNPSQR